jgi:hypothetical protein
MTSAWELAVLLKPTLNAVGSAANPPVAFQVEGPTLAPDINRSVDASTLQLQPWSEAETSLDRGDMQGAERVINVICQKPLDNGGEENCFQWLNAVKAAFPELSLAGPDGNWRWTGNETVTLFDTDAAKDKMQFLSVFRATFQNFA